MTQKLYEITITTHNGDTFTVTDTAECPMASQSLATFEKGGSMRFLVGDDEYIVPASAVDNILVNYTEEEITPPEFSC